MLGANEACNIYSCACGWGTRHSFSIVQPRTNDIPLLGVWLPWHATPGQITFNRKASVCEGFGDFGESPNKKLAGSRQVSTYDGFAGLEQAGDSSSGMAIMEDKPLSFEGVGKALRSLLPHIC